MGLKIRQETYKIVIVQMLLKIIG